MIEDKHSEFAKHINELQVVLDSPYSKDIDKKLLESGDDINHLNKEIQHINPDYMTFLPSYFWYWYFCIVWVYVSTLFLSNFIYDDVTYVYVRAEGWGIINIIGTLLYIFATGIPIIILSYQFFKKNPYRTQYYFLKTEQKVAYYYRPSLQLFKPFELKIVDYKDIIPEIHTMKSNTAYKPLNLYVADPKTGSITHHIKPHDVYVDPRVQWAFIRTYMERPAEELPIDNEICQAYPADTSKSLFACADIIYRKLDILNSRHTGAGRVVMLIVGSLIALGNLFQANHYQCTKRAILHPEVKRLLTWDGKHNPYPIQPITPEAQKAFLGKNWQVNLSWIVAIGINVWLFALAVMAYNS